MHRYYLVALPGHQFAEDPLRIPTRVDVGAIEEVDSGLATSGVDRGAGLAVGLATERHGTEAQLGDFDSRAAEGDLPHLRTLPW